LQGLYRNKKNERKEAGVIQSFFKANCKGYIGIKKMKDWMAINCKGYIGIKKMKVVELIKSLQWLCEIKKNERIY